jgi:hypothetical protein
MKAREQILTESQAAQLFGAPVPHDAVPARVFTAEQVAQWQIAQAKRTAQAATEQRRRDRQRNLALELCELMEDDSNFQQLQRRTECELRQMIDAQNRFIADTERRKVEDAVNAASIKARAATVAR